MSRPQYNRIVHEPPLFSSFKPVGIPEHSLNRIQLTLDEFEAFRLADQMELSQSEAADEMGISRSTFTRLIAKARKKMADFLINGGMLTIEGGSVHFRNNIIRCSGCGHMFKILMHVNMNECPVCDSEDLINLAGGFGHGKCCDLNHL